MTPLALRLFLVGLLLLVLAGLLFLLLLLRVRRVAVHDLPKPSGVFPNSGIVS